ncbi:MAG: DUF763 domain-containing protein [Candidatus Aenigmatarchaeota archaeon]
MFKSGIADLPLHYGHAPKWLFIKMTKLSRCIAEIIILEYSKKEFLKRISDPFFFQAFGCAVGFDWHSSGLTTTLTAALKEARLEDLGIAILGGKGKASKKTPNEIENLQTKFSLSDKKIEELKYASKIVARVDNNCLQDNFNLYHHSFFVTENGKWAVVQQGLNNETKYARRYHWLSFNLKSFVDEPHLAICCDVKVKPLNLVARESEEVREDIVDLTKENPENLKKYFWVKNSLMKFLKMSAQHEIDLSLYKKLMDLRNFQPKNFEEIVMMKNIGAKTLRSLALLSNLIYGSEISFRDPVKYSFAHGGKDKRPYPIDRKTYESSIEILQDAIRNACLGNREKLEAIKRLQFFVK